jgi:hypothetical protein
MDHASKTLSVETGIGFGATAGADKLTLKLMLSRDLNQDTSTARISANALLAAHRRCIAG